LLRFELRLSFKSEFKNLQGISTKQLKTLGVFMSDKNSVVADPALGGLLAAIRQGDFDDVKRHLENGADIDAKETKSHKDIPLIAAVESGNQDMLQFLLDAGAIVNRRYTFSPLSQAALELKDPGMVKLLLSNGANPNTAVHQASVLSHCCSALFEDKEKDFNDDYRLVHVPIDDSSYEIASLLLEAGASPDGERNHVPAAPLEYPLMANDLRTIELLIKHGAKLTPTAIFSSACFCAREGLIEALQLILDNGWKPNPKKAKNKAPASPLNYAVARGHLNIIELLIKHKIKLDYIPKDRLSTAYLKRSFSGHCVNVAIICGQHAALRLLLQSGASPNGAVEVTEDTSADRPQPLTLASYLGDTEAIKILLEHGADINEQSGHVYGEYKDCSSKTPLQVASEAGHQAVIDLLLERGATS
jgi:ankyrin repeat protein